MLDALKAIIAKLFASLRGEERASRLPPLDSADSVAVESSAVDEISVAQEHIRRIEHRVDILERAGAKFERSSRDVRRVKAYFILSARASLSFKPDLFSAIILLFLVASIAVMGVGASFRNVKVFCEYVAYVFPLFAGLVAAGGLYLDKPIMRQVWRRDKSRASERRRRRGFLGKYLPMSLVFKRPPSWFSCHYFSLWGPRASSRISILPYLAF